MALAGVQRRFAGFYPEDLKRTSHPPTSCDFCPPSRRRTGAGKQQPEDAAIILLPGSEGHPKRVVIAIKHSGERRADKTISGISPPMTVFTSALPLFTRSV
ncbi:hypothetical protein KCP76_04895 [Salmonella enterica subsp. enterica serovar Weltevreden]|nr:hypothetical protein KCP76_04895 [Salmonella enterica subsp. enterica serovar Weltevreden]